ncbi:MAG: hypothetical protein Fur003_3330 [Candidatus Dojkabacteria bacterium]
MWLLTVIVFILVVVSSLPTIYQLQIKDYLLYRIFSGERKLELKLIPFKLPAKSIRNMLIFGISLLLNGLTLWLLLNWAFFNETLIKLAALTFWIPIAKLYVIIGMLISLPIAEFKRKSIINKAREKLTHFPELEVIGITGSYGKTSVKENIFQLLSSKFKVAKTPENNNTLLGHAMAVLSQLQQGDKYMVAEYGAYKKGNIKETASLLKPKRAVLTGLGNQHMELFGSQDNLVKAKAELFQALPADGISYLNYDTDNYALISALIGGKKVNYSVKDNSADIYASDIKINVEGKSTFNVVYGDNKASFEAIVLGKHNILNLLPAIALAFDFGMNVKEVQLALNNLQPPKERLNYLKIANLKVLDDSYNSSYEGFVAALEVLESINGQRHVVSKGLLELGNVKSQTYSSLAQKFKTSDVKLWTTDAEFTKHGLTNVELFDNEKTLFDKLKSTLKPGDVLLIEGRVNPLLKKEFFDRK